VAADTDDVQIVTEARKCHELAHGHDDAAVAEAARMAE